MARRRCSGEKTVELCELRTAAVDRKPARESRQDVFPGHGFVPKAGFAEKIQYLFGRVRKMGLEHPPDQQRDERILGHFPACEESGR